MKRFIVFVIILILVQMSFAQQKLTLKDIFTTPNIHLKQLDNPQWLPGSTAFIFVKNDKDKKIASLYKNDIKSGKETLWLDGNLLKLKDGKKLLKFSNYKISKNKHYILLKTAARRVWRHYDLARYYIYDRFQKNIIPVQDKGLRILHTKISPDEKNVGYVFKNNIYIKNLNSGKTIRITADGHPDIINGQFDWVYEEEFGQVDGWRWSPDGRKIAFWRLDQSHEPTFSWCEFDSAYGSVKTIHYPEAGGSNALVQIGVFDLDEHRTNWMDIGSKTDIYIPRINWTPDSRHLAIQRLNRLQNRLDFIMADAKSGKSKVLFSDKDSCWVNIFDDLHFLKHSKQFIWTSERDGFKHIYLYNLSGKLERQLTKGNWECKQVYGIAENSKRVFFSANKGSSIEQQLFSIGLNGKNMKKLSAKIGTHSAYFSPDMSYFLHYYSSACIPPQVTLCNNHGKTIRKIIENNSDALKDHALVYPGFIKFQTTDGVWLNAQITKPLDFDPHKKYPVLIYGYGGPGSQMVRNSWGRTSSKLWYTLLTQKGYIIFTLDNRGTGGRGKAFENLSYHNIGKYALKDHIEGAKYLASLPYVDQKRIGIWGWSGGGYLTLMALTKGSHYFKAGIAVAPVTDFRLYDDIWTERYMGLPKNNQAGYDSASVLNYVERYKKGLLLVHGTADDNVHILNSMQFVSKMESLNKQFQMRVYPGRNHSLLGRNKKNVYLNLYTLMTNFILENL